MKKLIVSLMTIVVLAGLFAGQALAQEPAQQPGVTCEAEYTVQAGDWLGLIAEKYYGDVQAYELIMQANNLQPADAYPDLASANTITAGQLLCLPPNPAAEAAALDSAQPQLVGPVWQWQQTQMNNGDLFTAPAPASYTLQFMADGTAAIQADCNTVQATYTLTDTRISLTMGPATRMACPEGSLGDQFVANLSAANLFFFQDGNLFIDLLFDSGTMSFANPAAAAETAPAAQPQLVGPIWQWQQTQMNNGDLFTPPTPASYTVQFMADGSAAIQADCNTVQATYTLTDTRISLAMGPSTLMACPEGSLGDQFVANLSAANLFFFQDGNLFIDLLFDSGTMSFSPISSQLPGSNWLVTNYNNGRQAVVGMLPDTELTAYFDEDGTLSGSAGCNRYNAGYEVGDGNTITIGPAAATMMFCAEPEGVMQQEQEYLAALSTAATYQMTGNTMTLRTAADEMAAVFARVPAPVTLADDVLTRITLVQHSFNPETNNTSFTCASSGQGLNGVAVDAAGARFVGPNAGDFDLWGAVGLFQVNSDGTMQFVPERTGGKFVSPDGFEFRQLSMSRIMDYFATGQAIWTGDFGQPGRIAECDPTFQ